MRRLARLVLALCVVPVALIGDAGQGGSLRIPARITPTGGGNEGPPPLPPDEVVITTPATPSVQTTEATQVLAGTASALITTVTWANAATGGSGSAVLDLLTGLWTVAVPASSVRFSHNFDSAANQNLTATTPQVGASWTTLVGDGGIYCENRSADYVQPSASDTGGTARLICLAVPDTTPATNVVASIQLATGFYNASSTSAFGLVFNVADPSNYCAVELLTANANPDVRLVQVVAGVPTVLAMGDAGPIAGQTWAVRRIGNDITVEQDGVSRLTATEAGCAGHTSTGIAFGAFRPGSTRTITTSLRVDNFTLEDPDAGTGVALDTGVNAITVEGCRADGVSCVTDTVVVTRGVSDTTDPTGTVTSPTGGLTYTTTNPSITWQGTAADNAGVASVVVDCTTCTPTSITASLVNGAWSAGPFAQAEGDNDFVITITDTSANETVLPTRRSTYTVGTDTTPPSIAVVTPNGIGSSTTTTTPVTLAGAASDNIALAEVTYASDTCGAGTASGTTAWSIQIALTADCSVTVTARDTAGLTATAQHAFTFTPPLQITTQSQLPLAIQSTSYSTQTLIAIGGTPPYTWDNNAGGTSLGGGACTGGTITDNENVGEIAGTFTTTGSCVTTIRVCDDAAVCATKSFTLPVSTGALGGQNNTHFDTLCARADMRRCVSMRSPADIATYAQVKGTRVDRTGAKVWSYDPANDTYPQRQDAAKVLFPAWIPFNTTKTLGAALSASTPGTVELITLSPTVAGMSGGAALRLDTEDSHEIIACVSPAAGVNCLVNGSNGTQFWGMRGAYGTSALAHAAGTVAWEGTKDLPEQAFWPVNGSTVSSETMFAFVDVYFGAEWANFGAPTTCAGVYNLQFTTNDCALQFTGYKAMQWRSGGNSITWETKLETNISHNSLRPTGINTTTGGDIGGIIQRNYTVLGAPYTGAEYLRPPNYKDFIYKPSKWIRFAWLIETNHDTNVASFGPLTTIIGGLAADAEATTVTFDHSMLPVAPPNGEAWNNYRIIYDSASQKGRRVRIGSEAVSLESCTVNGATNRYDPVVCTVVRGVDGTSIAAHADGATASVNWDYVSLWVADEDHDFQLVFDRLPTLRRRNGTTGALGSLVNFNWEWDSSATRMQAHRWNGGDDFIDYVQYMKNFVVLRKAGTGGFGGGTMPAEWQPLLVRPTVGGN